MGYGGAKGKGRGGCDDLADCNADNPIAWACCGCAALAIVVTAIVLIVASFSTLEPTEVGIKYDTVTQTLDEKEVRGG